ncbi:MAG: LysM peptidoglycan-binding domain-containing protein [Propionicimonas sp.]|uniref:LysM peptidoglycan-binding domain-containing protein n=1 Tax=Propionicimonas sp. TaxID=1955623 RepID=UPI003D12E29E
MRWLKGLGAGAALLLALVGAPLALLAWGRLPSGWADLIRPDDGTLLLGVLTVAGWIAWAAFAASTLVEAVRLGDREHRPLRLPLLGGLQGVSAGLLLAVLALAPSGTPSQTAGDALVVAAPREPVAPPPEGAVEAPTEQVEQDADHYTVEPGDDLWSISVRLLGDGARWRELAAANPAHLHDPTTRLAPGTWLTLPASVARAATHVRVERGDTLSGLALEYLGDAGRWPRIAEANAHLVEDPDHIEVGWRLTVPGAAATDRATPERQDDHDERSSASRDGEGGAREPSSPDGEAGHGRTSRDDETEVGRASRDDETEVGRASRDDETEVGRSSPAPSPDVPPERVDAPTASTGAADDAQAPAPALPLLGTLGTLAAAAILGVVETRRTLRLRERPVGRRLIPPDEEATRLRAGLGARQRPRPLTVLDAALRAVGRHCHVRRIPLPDLARAVVGPTSVVLEWASPTVLPPAGFTGTRDRWEAALAEPPDVGDHPCPFPALVSLGSTADGDRLVLVDAERSRVLAVASDDPELRRSALAAMAVELACAPWSAEARLVVVGADARLVALAGGDRVHTAQPDEALGDLRTLVARRRAALGDEPLAALRVDPDRADAVAPVVVCLLDDVPPDVAEELDEVLAGPATGTAVLLGTRSEAAAQWQVGGGADAPTGRLAGVGEQLVAHAIPEATRAGVVRLLAAADDPSTTPAPWWGGEDDGAGNVRTLPPRAQRGGDVDIVRLVASAENPQVLLLGPAELTGAPGPEPTRSRQQLVELCAWLLEHPASTATAMAAGLAVAESTRRSNLSRLRAWLGDAPDGKPYLPDAYSGRVVLHPGVGSDWHRLQLLLAPGVDRVGDSTLVAALELVRGAPLADAAPSQWHWAEELRTDASSALRDVGVVLAERALARGDIDLARWAAARALAAAPDDELLLCARIRTEHRAGNAAEVERLVRQVTGSARTLGVDLLPETVELCQQVIEGRLRARA